MYLVNYYLFLYYLAHAYRVNRTLIDIICHIQRRNYRQIATNNNVSQSSRDILTHPAYFLAFHISVVRFDAGVKNETNRFPL